MDEFGRTLGDGALRLYVEVEALVGKRHRDGSGDRDGASVRAPQLPRLLELVEVVPHCDLGDAEALADVRNLKRCATVDLIDNHGATLVNRYLVVVLVLLPHGSYFLILRDFGGVPPATITEGFRK